MIERETILSSYKKHLENKGNVSPRIIRAKLAAMRTFLSHFEEKGIELSQISRETLQEFLGKLHYRGAIKFLEKENLVILKPSVNTGVEINKEMKELIEDFMNFRTLKGQGKELRKMRVFWLNIFVQYLTERNVSDIRNVTRKVIADYSLYLLFYRTARGNRPLKTASRLFALITVRNFFKFLCKKDILLSNPAADVELPKSRVSLSRDIPTVNEIDSILSVINLKAPHGIRDYAMIETLYGTGMRGPELLRLKIEDIDFENSLVTIRQGKGRKDRVVPVNSIALSFLREYLEAREKLLSGMPDAGLLFISNGRKIDNDYFRHIIQRYAKKAGVKKHLIAHSFRYACATHMLKNGADIRYIQELLGHESLSTTQGYTRVVKGDLKRMLRKFHPREDNDNE